MLCDKEGRLVVLHYEIPCASQLSLTIYKLPRLGGKKSVWKFNYNESSVIRTSIIRILDYPDHKITLHVTHGLCNYRTNAHTQYM